MIPHIVIATPCYGGQQTMEFTMGFMNAVSALSASGVRWDVRFIGNESLITRARCRLTHDFLKTNATHLFFWDADVKSNGVDVAKMLGKMLRNRFDVLAGLYPKKAIFWPGVSSAARAGESPETIESAGARFPFNPINVAEWESLDECIEVYDAPTGFMLIARETIERVIEANPNDWYISEADSDRGEPTYEVFETMRDSNRRKLSEDYAFCRKVQAAGMKIWVDTTVELGHVGSYRFTGRIADLLEPSEQEKVST